MARELVEALEDIDQFIASGQHSRAQRACRGLLGRFPTSASVHERMGDVLYARELWQDAAEWYALAAQLAETEKVRAKLADAERRAKEARLGGGDTYELAHVAARRHRRLLLLLGAAAVITVTVLVFVIVRVAGGPEAESPVTDAETVATGEAPSVLGFTGPRVARGIKSSPRAPGPGAAAAGAHENPRKHWAAQEAPPRPSQPPRSSEVTLIQSLSQPLTAEDRVVVSTVASRNWGEGRDLNGRVSAMVDPYTGFAFISVTVPDDLPQSHLIEEVVRQAHRVCLAAIRANESIKYITIRMVKNLGGKEAVTAFRGNTSRAALEKY